ncbi:hypothetical protein CHS0354_007681 [Potamilus streckersoni]|uniref:Uncharacterized protein n=1 Tax=Potamilus streckersoni TaxID=2493646 RepID=A0AAE0VVT1_9BIVA|nr:hypothetical protein CHS0354_007681 [Potamilus streckersoni]
MTGCKQGEKNPTKTDETGDPVNQLTQNDKALAKCVVDNKTLQALDTWVVDNKTLQALAKCMVDNKTLHTLTTSVVRKCYNLRTCYVFVETM